MPGTDVGYAAPRIWYVGSLAIVRLQARVSEVGLLDGHCLRTLTSPEVPTLWPRYLRSLCCYAIATACPGESDAWPQTFTLGEEAVKFNGFFFQTWDGDPGLDPMLISQLVGAIGLCRAREWNPGTRTEIAYAGHVDGAVGGRTLGRGALGSYPYAPTPMLPTP
eukprot:3773656-Rhodomonas_salina.4